MSHKCTEIYHTRCLVQLKPLEEVSKGGIIMPVTRGRNQYDMHLATFLIAGNTAFKDDPGKPQPGDPVWIAIDMAIKFKGENGQEYMFINDKEVIAKAAA